MANLSYVHKIGKEPLRAVTLGTLLEKTVAKFPQREAIVSLQQNHRLTYQELLQKADEFAAGLRILGLQKGDRLGLWAPNMVEWVVVNMACVRSGLLMVSINPHNQAGEIEYCINKVGIKAIICPHEGKYHNFYNILAIIAPELMTAECRKLESQNVPSLKTVILLSDDKLNGAYNYNEVLKLANQKTVTSIKNSQHLIRPDDPCYIQFSSGTTGEPKAAVASHFQVVNNSFYVGKRNELDQKPHRISVQVPFFHVYGTTVAIAAAINFGSTLVLPSTYYSPRENLRALKEEKCSVIYGTPTMYVDLINMQTHLNEDISSEIAVTGGAPCTPELLKKMKKILNLKRVKAIYGMTECTAVVFHSLPAEEDEYIVTSTVGQLGDHLEAKVVDEHDNIVPVGTPGELCVRGYSVMLSYWDDQEKTKQIVGLDRWLRTGDQFIIQGDGYGRIVGRLKDMIIRGGENIYPKEIEDLLSTHPDILEAHVIGLPHERLGEEVCACVRLREGATLALTTIAKFLEGKLTFSKIPSQLRIVENFPKTASGKIQKRFLIAKFADQTKFPTRIVKG